MKRATAVSEALSIVIKLREPMARDNRVGWEILYRVAQRLIHEAQIAAQGMIAEEVQS